MRSCLTNDHLVSQNKAVDPTKSTQRSTFDTWRGYIHMGFVHIQLTFAVF